MPTYLMCCPFLGIARDHRPLALACLLVCDVRVDVGHPERVVASATVELCMN